MEHLIGMTEVLESSLADSGVLSLTFNRPEKKNAFDQALYGALVGALSEAKANDAVRVVLLRGAGGVFTAGNDLKDFMSNPPMSEDNVILRFLYALVDFPKPIVAAVEGPAVGIGTTLLLHCDMVFADPSAQFVLPFVKLGLVPEGASSVMLPRMAGHARAAELLMLGEPFSADVAVEIGLANRVASPAEAAAAATTLAHRPMASLLGAKELLRGPDREATRETIRREAQLFGQRLTSPEAMEAFQAFFEKREPDFRKVESAT